MRGEGEGEGEGTDSMQQDTTGCAREGRGGD